VTASAPAQKKKDCGCDCGGRCQETAKSSGKAQPSANGEPDFSKMTPAEKIAYHKARWDRVLG